MLFSYLGLKVRKTQFQVSLSYPEQHQIERSQVFGLWLIEEASFFFSKKMNFSLIGFEPTTLLILSVSFPENFTVSAFYFKKSGIL